MKQSVFFFLVFAGLFSCSAPNSFPNILDLKNTPTTAKQGGLSAFFDLGSWMGFALPENENSSGFVGPYLLGVEHGKWCSGSFINLELGEVIESDFNYYPGRLESDIKYEGLSVKNSLIFTSKSTALISSSITNVSVRSQEIKAVWSGEIFEGIGELKAKSNHVVLEIIGGQKLYLTPLEHENAQIECDGEVYRISPQSMTLKAGETTTLYLEIDYHPDIDTADAPSSLEDAEQGLIENLKRWKEYLEVAQNDLVLTKSVCTLINNWRSAAGELKHDGLFPSYHYKWFRGFWAWDSWKHAVALVKINPLLAQEQIRAMYDYQDSDGMIADCVFRDTLIESHNLRDTKPPLSGWAIWEVYLETKDSEFLKELYPKLVKYHNWWYNFRDCDSDGLCEYGSTDGTLTAAKWESGMDNAIRFDQSFIVEGSSFSINSESVDLNCYLAKEKEYLYKIAEALKLEEAALWLEEYRLLSNRITSTFFDEEKGYFFDIDYQTGEFQNSALGPEGWTPLWCGIATETQAAAVKGKMMDPEKFNAMVPLPTIDVSHESFDPEDGYWRGPVWLDQVWFGYEGLKKYGYLDEASNVRRKVLENCSGVSEIGKPIRENYHPLTGEGLNAEHFSWSAAHLILMQP